MPGSESNFGRRARIPVLMAGVLAAALLPACASAANSGPAPEAVASIIIDDLGYRHEDSLRALTLPRAVAVSILPDSPYGRSLAERAWRQGREVLLHLPMQARDGARLGPGGLYARMGAGAIARVVRADLRAVPHAVGVNNHMGSLLTADPRAMREVMAVLRARGGLFFIDSRTTRRTVAERAALAAGLSTARRNVFLDDVLERRAIRVQMRKLIAMARRRGSALGIGHPFPQTLAVVRSMLPEFAANGVRLVPLEALVTRRGAARRHLLWQAAAAPTPGTAP